MGEGGETEMVTGATTFDELATSSAEGTALFFDIALPRAEVAPFGHLDPFVFLYLVDRLGDGPGDDSPGDEGDEEGEN